MRFQLFVLIVALFFSAPVHAQTSDVDQLRQEMEADGIHVASLLNFAADEFFQKAQEVSEERSLGQGYQNFKTEVVASLYVSREARFNNYPNGYVVGNRGSRGLSLESTQDLLDAAWAFEVSLAQKSSFSLKMTCRRIDGQGREPFTWCGFSK